MLTINPTPNSNPSLCVLCVSVVISRSGFGVPLIFERNGISSIFDIVTRRLVYTAIRGEDHYQ